MNAAAWKFTTDWHLAERMAAHVESMLRREPRVLGIRGFRMTRAEAAEWIRAADAAMDIPPDSSPSLADNIESANRADLIEWSRIWREPTTADGQELMYSRLVAAIMLAAARGAR